MAGAVAAALLLSGCAGTVPVNYAPSSSLSASGSIEVTDFKYMPAVNGKMKPNQVRNTALGTVLLDKNVDQFFRDAVFTELRFVGVKVAGSNKRLSGEINEFLIDDLGYSIDWTLDVHYVVTDMSGKTIYDSTKTTKNRTAKFTEPLTALNVQLKQNIEALIQDSNFVRAIN